MSTKRSSSILAFAVASVLLAFPIVSAQTSSPPAAQPLLSSEALNTAVALLDRIDRLVAAARKPVGADDLAPAAASGSAASAMVDVRAADLDEIRAEIAQIKSLLRPVATEPQGASQAASK